MMDNAVRGIGEEKIERLQANYVLHNEAVDK